MPAQTRQRDPQALPHGSPSSRPLQGPTLATIRLRLSGLGGPGRPGLGTTPAEAPAGPHLPAGRPAVTCVTTPLIAWPG